MKKDDGGNSKSKNGTSNKTLSIIIIALLLLLIVVGSVIAYALINNDDGSGNGGNGVSDGNDNLISRDVLTPREVVGGTGAVLTPENYQSLLSEFREPSPDDSYTVNTSAEYRFDKNGVAESTTFIRNHKSNRRMVYFDFFLNGEDEESDELLYSSPYIPVGEEVRDFSLSRALPEGEYKVTVVYHLVDDENEYAEITTLSVGGTLIIT